MSQRPRKHTGTPASHSVRQPATTAYDIMYDPGRECATLTIRHGHRVYRDTITRPDQPLDPLEPRPSLAQALAETILTDYFEHTNGVGPQVQALARSHTTTLSRLLSARLTATTTHAITLTAKEISGRILTHIFSPPTDHWIARYSIPRSTGTGTWTVAQHKNGSWGCSCPRYRFKREQCKHIDEVQAHPDWYPYQP